MTDRVDIETDYMLSSHLGDWETLYNELNKTADSGIWELRRLSPIVYRQIVEAVNKRSLSNGLSRQVAWSLLVGVCHQNI